MSKNYKILFGAFVAVILFLTYLESTEPQPINWNASYSKHDKIPLGAYVIFQNLKRLDNVRLQEKNLPPYEQLDQEELNGTYFFLNNLVGFDDAELDKMLSWVEKGNHLFVSANYISENLYDTLNLEAKETFLINDIDSKPLFSLANPAFQSKEGYLFDHDVSISVFEKIDTLNTRVLGFAEPQQNGSEVTDPLVNFVQTNFGEGKITIHLAPEAFSNYFLLHENNIQYARQALSYIDTSEEILWDNYYKSGKTFYTSPLYIFLQNKQFKWAYYFALIGALLFIIFEGKRKQRSIPVVEPLKNQTYNYTRTIAGLYLDKKQYREIAAKKIKLFLEYVRTKLRVHSTRIDKEFYETVASRSGNNLEDTKALFEKIRQIEAKNRISKQELLELSQAINSYKNASHDGK